MLSSDARKMLQFVRDCEHLSHDEVIERCIAERSTGTRKRHGRQATPWECCCPMSSAIPRPTVDWPMRSWRIFSDTATRPRLPSTLTINLKQFCRRFFRDLATGRSPMSAKREIAAHHEAGHAVVALAFGATGECRRSSRDRARWIGIPDAS